MRLVVLLLAASMLVPAAQAAILPGGCFFTVAAPCYHETAEGDDCGAPGATGSSSTNVMVLSPAGILIVSGSSWCNAFDAYESVSVGFFSGANVVIVNWDESGSAGCHTTATAFVAGAYQRQDAGCPAGGPPNPGWGELLP